MSFGRFIFQVLASVAGAATLALALAALPVGAEAQDAGKVRQIGFLSPYSSEQDRSKLAAFEQALRGLGYAEGTVTLVQRHAGGRFDRLPALAAEMARLPLDVLVAHGDAGLHAKQAIMDIPIVLVAHPDPVGMGIVPSLARPGGNVTGLSDQHGDLVAKRLTLLKEATPSASRIGVLSRADVPAHPPQLKNVRAAAPSARVAVVPLEIRGPQDLDGLFSTIRAERVDALHVLGGAGGAQRRQLVQLAIRHRVPTISTTKEFAEDGGLISYGSSFPDLYRRAAFYVDRILRGARPADLPIEQPTRFELIIDLRTARALGLTIPRAMVLRADEVIE